MCHRLAVAGYDRETAIERGHDGLRVRTTRIINWTGGARHEDDLACSHYVSTPRIVARAHGHPANARTSA